MIISRYTFMKTGDHLDIDGSQFPDPLTLNYNNFTATSKLTSIEMTEDNIKFFWKIVYEYYGTAELDDIVLSLNGISHKNFLVPEMVIYLPAREDIISSLSIKTT